MSPSNIKEQWLWRKTLDKTSYKPGGEAGRKKRKVDEGKKKGKTRVWFLLVGRKDRWPRGKESRAEDELHSRHFNCCWRKEGERGEREGRRQGRPTNTSSLALSLSVTQALSLLLTLFSHLLSLSLPLAASQISTYQTSHSLSCPLFCSIQLYSTLMLISLYQENSTVKENIFHVHLVLTCITHIFIDYVSWLRVGMGILSNFHVWVPALNHNRDKKKSNVRIGSEINTQAKMQVGVGVNLL